MKIRCFGMTDALLARLAQHNPHLAKQGVGSGDVFLFFGLFAELASNDRHHRIFGYLNVEKVVKIGAQPSSDELEGTPRRHPHTIAKWDSDEKRWDPNNTIYLGRGRKAKKAHEALRLTKPGGPPSHWVVPDWLRETGLTYHQNTLRWADDRGLRVVGRGQEFVADVGDRPEAKKWLEGLIVAIGDADSQ
jgi:Nucleotide modification associated domain 3